MKVHGIAGTFIIPGNVLPSEAQEGGETDVEAGRRILGQRKIFSNRLGSRPTISLGVSSANGDKGRGIILLACRRSKRTRPCISCRRYAGR